MWVSSLRSDWMIFPGLVEGVFQSVRAKELSHLVNAVYRESAKRNALSKVIALEKDFLIY